MGTISLNLLDDLLEACGDCAVALRLSRAEYVRCTIDRLNWDTRSRLRATPLAQVSRRVRAESMRVNPEFAAIEWDPKATP